MRRKEKNYVTKAEQTKELNKIKKLKRQEEAKKPYECECGSILKNKTCLYAHNKSWLHTNYLYTIGEL